MTARRLAAAAWLLAAPATAARRAPAPPPAFHVRVEVKPTALTVGDRAAVTVTFAAPAGIRFAPAISGTLADDWELAGVAPLAPKALPDGTVETPFVVVLIPWSATTTGTPPLGFAAIAADAVPHGLTVASAPVTLTSVLAGEKDASTLKPAKGVIGYRSWWPWILGGLALLAAGLGAWWWSGRRRRAAAAALAGAPRRPPEEEARAALAALLGSDWLERGEIKRFYIGLSDILRRYLEGRFGISALDRTTAELLPELRSTPALRPLAGELRVFFEDCDLVKFARYVPPREEIEADVARGRRLVDETAPRAAPPPGPAPEPRP